MINYAGQRVLGAFHRLAFIPSECYYLVVAVPMMQGKEKVKRKYDIRIDGYSIRNAADLDRVDMSKSERAWKHRKEKLKKRAENREQGGLDGLLV